MAVYQFSALSDGRAISFNPSSDVLRFDQTAFAAADIRATVEGANLRISVAAGTSAGKDVLLLNVSPLQLTTTNLTFASGTRLAVGDATVGTSADNGNNSLVGTSGRDHLAGFGGDDTLNGGSSADYLDGGLGNDTYFVSSGDVLVDAGGVDHVMSGVNWTLGVGFENLTLTGTSNILAVGNVLDNVLIGNTGNNGFSGRDGNDTLIGNAGNDTFVMSMSTNYGNDWIDAGVGTDVLDFGTNARSEIVVNLAGGWVTGGATNGGGSATLISIENVNGGAFNDLITGSGAANNLFGYNGNDTIDGGAGNDRLDGAGGTDQYVFSVAPGTANADTIVTFASGAEKIVLDGSVHANLGVNGNFSAGDARFVSGAGLTGGQDDSDRVVYNTATGQLFYDADGSGGGAAQLIATIQGAPALAATDIVAQNGASGRVFNGTDAADSIIGTDGDDTVLGNGGDDTIDGGRGNDWVDGGSSGPGINWMRGGAGNDTVLGGMQGNLLDGGDGNDQLFGLDGDDQFVGGAGDDYMSGAGGRDRFSIAEFETPGILGHGNDTIDGGAGQLDDIFIQQTSPLSIDLTAGTLSGGVPGSAVISNVEMVFVWFEDVFDDRMIGNASDNYLFAGGGNDTIDGAAGNDWVSGGFGNDSLTGGAGADNFRYQEAAGVANADRITDFTSGVDTIWLDGHMHRGIGDNGRFTWNDERFYAAAGASGGNDATDRVVYDISSGNLWFDGDGDGSGAAQLIATLTPGTALGPSDIMVENAIRPFFFQGGPANEEVWGDELNDTLNGGGGNDFLRGFAGDDILNGEDGNDTLEGGRGSDTVDGGSGDDTYLVHRPESLGKGPEEPDAVSDSGGGRDTVVLTGEWWGYALGPSLEDLIVGAGFIRADTLFEDSIVLEGNAANNVIRIENAERTSFLFDGHEGDDLLVGGPGDEIFLFGPGHGNDSVNGGGGSWDEVLFRDVGPIVVDIQASTVSTAHGTVTFAQIERIDGADAGDRFVGGTAAVTMAGAGGDDTFVGGSGAEDLYGGSGPHHARVDTNTGNDQISGGAGNDYIDGGDGADTLNGGLGADVLWGNADEFSMDVQDADTFVFDVAPGLANADEVLNFQSGIDKIRLDGNAMLAVGPSGAFSATDPRFHAAAGANAGHDADDRVVYNTSTGQLWYDADGSGMQAAQLIATINWDRTLLASDIEVVNGNATPPPPSPSGGQNLTGTSAAETLTGGAGNDTISGLAGSDRLFGADGNDSLIGGTEADNMFGDNGNDWLDGDAGQDRVTGGAGADSFVYNDALAAANADYINDFVSGTDRILLDNAVMTALGPVGMLASGRFVAAANARSGLDSDDRLMYDTVSGKLYYDPDGSGAAGQSVIAVLTGAPTLAAADIVVI